MKSGLGREIPPEHGHVVIYFIQKGMSTKEADYFFHQQQENGWLTANGAQVCNWKTLANEWIWNEQQRQREVKAKSTFKIHVISK